MTIGWLHDINLKYNQGSVVKWEKKVYGLWKLSYGTVKVNLHVLAVTFSFQELYLKYNK